MRPIRALALLAILLLTASQVHAVRIRAASWEPAEPAVAAAAGDSGGSPPSALERLFRRSLSWLARRARGRRAPDARQREGSCRRPRAALDRAFGLQEQLLDLVFEFVPFQCYLVAAAADLASVVVWEVVVDWRPEARPRARAEFLREIRWSGSSLAVVDAIRFLPDSDTLVGNTYAEDTGSPPRSRCGAEFWDARSGAELLRIDKTEVVGSCAGGRIVFGRGGEVDDPRLTFWDASGHALWTFSPGRGLEGRRRIEAASSPDGEMVAVLVSHGLEADLAEVGVCWSVEIWSSSTGERACSLEVLRSVDPHPGHWDFAFDGSTVAICHDTPGVLLKVVRHASACELVPIEAPGRCEATHLASSSQLEITPDSVQVLALGESSSRTRHLAPLRAERNWDSFLHAVFSPDGRTVAFTRQDKSLIWRLGSDEPLRTICEGRPDSLPSFSADSTIVAVVCKLSEVVLFDSTGVELLRLTPGRDAKARILRHVVVSGRRP